MSRIGPSPIAPASSLAHFVRYAEEHFDPSCCIWRTKAPGGQLVPDDLQDWHVYWVADPDWFFIESVSSMRCPLLEDDLALDLFTEEEIQKRYCESILESARLCN